MYARNISTNPKIVNLATNLPLHPKTSFPKITQIIKTQAINENKVLWSKIKILLPNSKLTKTPEIKVPVKSKRVINKILNSDESSSSSEGRDREGCLVFKTLNDFS